MLFHYKILFTMNIYSAYVKNVCVCVGIGVGKVI